MENYTGKKYVNIKYHINITHDQVSFKITLKNLKTPTTWRRYDKPQNGRLVIKHIDTLSTIGFKYSLHASSNCIHSDRFRSTDIRIMSRKTFNFHINTTLSEFFRLASVPKYKSSFATSFLQWRR